MMILVTGGARSGKSRHAEALIGDAPQVLYIATSQILDDEMGREFSIIKMAGRHTGGPQNAGGILIR